MHVCAVLLSLLPSLLVLHSRACTRMCVYVSLCVCVCVRARAHVSVSLSLPPPPPSLTPPLPLFLVELRRQGRTRMRNDVMPSWCQPDHQPDDVSAALYCTKNLSDIAEGGRRPGMSRLLARR